MPIKVSDDEATKLDVGTSGGCEACDLENDTCYIPRASLLRVIQGVAVATKAVEEDIEPIIQCVSSARTLEYYRTLRSDEARSERAQFDQIGSSLSLHGWVSLLLDQLNNHRCRQIATLVVSVAYLREHSRQTECGPVSPEIMSTVWKMIHGVLTDSSLTPPVCSATRSAQGFLSVALCSLIEEGNLDELFRLHVWLPDGRRGKSENSVHSHQPFAQSWILAGEGTDLSYNVQSVRDHTATHAEYIPAWSDGKSLSTTYKTHQTISVIANTGSLVRATLARSATHTRDTTYSIPSAMFHASHVRPEILHATLFFFDSQRGFKKDASVLGPVNGGSVVAHRDPAGITAAALAETVEFVRLWEVCMEEGRDSIQHGKLRDAANHFEGALRLCERLKSLLDSSYYQGLASSELEKIETQLAGQQEPRFDYLHQMSMPAFGLVYPSR